MAVCTCGRWMPGRTEADGDAADLTAVSPDLWARVKAEAERDALRELMIALHNDLMPPSRLGNQRRRTWCDRIRAALDQPEEQP